MRKFMQTTTDRQPNATCKSELRPTDGMIKSRDIEKSYRTKAGFTYVLRQINLDIAQGEFVSE
jgi:ABC-type transport system involved in cytochrome bd biosynthesis fused ATPase/permease subunit